jgi:hypothetical protein
MLGLHRAVPPTASPAGGGGAARRRPPIFEVEYEEPLIVTCDCCGAPETRLTRFVKRDGDAYAVYLVRYVDGQQMHPACAVVSLGTWGVDGVPPDRVAFALRIPHHPDEYQVEVIDGAELAWKKSEILGRKLSRDEALAHPWLPEVYRLFDHMVENDAPLHAFLDHAPNRPPE